MEMVNSPITQVIIMTESGNMIKGIVTESSIQKKIYLFIKVSGKMIDIMDTAS